MNILLIQKIFRNKILKTKIFNYTREVQKIKNGEFVQLFRWNELIEKPEVMAGNGYLDLLKLYFARANRAQIAEYTAKRHNSLQLLSNAVYGQSLPVLRYLIEELNIEPLPTKFNSFDLLYHAININRDHIPKATTTDTLDYLPLNHDIITYLLLPEIVMKYKWNYKDALSIAPFTNNIEFLKYMSDCYNKSLSSSGFIQRDMTTSKFNVFDSASCVGRIDMIEWLAVNRSRDLSESNMYVSAIKAGQLRVIQFLYQNRQGYPLPNDTYCGEGYEFFISQRLLDLTAYSNHLQVLKFLHYNKLGNATMMAMEYAAYHGNVEMLAWLHDNRTEGCTNSAMDIAASNGHLEVVKYLQSNRSEGCTEAAIDSAAANGYLNVVRYLHDNRSEGCTESAMDGAASNGHLDVIQWLHLNRTERCTYRALIGATPHFEVLKYLISEKVYSETDNDELMVKIFSKAIKERQFVTAKWLKELKPNINFIKDETLLQNSIKVDDIDTLEWFYENIVIYQFQNQNINQPLINFALQNKALKIVNFIAQKQKQQLNI